MLSVDVTSYMEKGLAGISLGYLSPGDDHAPSVTIIVSIPTRLSSVKGGGLGRYLWWQHSSTKVRSRTRVVSRLPGSSLFLPPHLVAAVGSVQEQLQTWELDRLPFEPRRSRLQTFLLYSVSLSVYFCFVHLLKFVLVIFPVQGLQLIRSLINHTGRHGWKREERSPWTGRRVRGKG